MLIFFIIVCGILLFALSLILPTLTKIILYIIGYGVIFAVVGFVGKAIYIFLEPMSWKGRLYGIFSILKIILVTVGGLALYICLFVFIGRSCL